MPPTVTIEQMIHRLTPPLRASGLDVPPEENGGLELFTEGVIVSVRQRESDPAKWQAEASTGRTATAIWSLAGNGIAVEAYGEQGHRSLALLARVDGWELDYFANFAAIERARTTGDLPAGFDETACRDAILRAFGLPALATWPRTLTAPVPPIPLPIGKGEHHPLFDRLEAALARTASAQKIRPSDDGRFWNLSFKGSIVHVFRMSRPTEIREWVSAKSREKGVREILATTNAAMVVAGSPLETVRWLHVVCDGGLEVGYFSNSIEIRKAKQRGDLPEHFEEREWIEALLQGAGALPIARWTNAAA